MVSARTCLTLALASAALLAACGASSAVGTAPQDGRTVLTYGGKATLGPAAADPCAQSFVTAAGTGTVAYENAAHGVQFNLPYSAAWGNKNYSVPAYEQTDADTVFFGPAVKQGSGCAWVRAMRLEFVPAADAPTVAAAAKKALQGQLKDDTLEMGSEPQVLAASNYTAVESLSVTPVCRLATLEIVGKAFNARISMCGRGAKRVEDFQPLRAIAKTMAAVR
jgi:hypothetical protein